MKPYVNILGVDPSLSNFGCVLARYHLESQQIEIVRMVLVETKPSKTKKGVRKNALDFERCVKLNHGFSFMQQTANLVIAEMPHGAKSASAMKSYGICLGILSSSKVPLIQVSAEETKIAACNDRLATKAEVIEWATKKYPEAAWIKTSTGRVVNKNEHLADAIAAIHAGIAKPRFQSVLNLIKLEENV